MFYFPLISLMYSLGTGSVSDLEHVLHSEEHHTVGWCPCGKPTDTLKPAKSSPQPCAKVSNTLFHWKTDTLLLFNVPWKAETLFNIVLCVLVVHWKRFWNWLGGLLKVVYPRLVYCYVWEGGKGWERATTFILMIITIILLRCHHSLSLANIVNFYSFNFVVTVVEGNH